MTDPVLMILGLIILLMLFMVLLLAKKQADIHRTVSNNQQRLEQLMDELKALYAGAAGQGSHIARMEEQINNLSDKQEQLGAQDLTTQAYSEAIELIQAGASVEELVRRGLRREEAELLMRMHGAQSLD